MTLNYLDIIMQSYTASVSVENRRVWMNVTEEGKYDIEFLREEEYMYACIYIYVYIYINFTSIYITYLHHS
jgi:hypothetical protein